MPLTISATKDRETKREEKVQRRTSSISVLLCPSLRGTSSPQIPLTISSPQTATSPTLLLLSAQEVRACFFTLHYHLLPSKILYKRRQGRPNTRFPFPPPLPSSPRNTLNSLAFPPSLLLLHSFLRRQLLLFLDVSFVPVARFQPLPTSTFPRSSPPRRLARPRLRTSPSSSRQRNQRSKRSGYECQAQSCCSSSGHRRRKRSDGVRMGCL